MTTNNHQVNYLELLPAVDVKDGKAVRLVQGELAQESIYGAPLEVALAWVRDTPGITSAIVGARTGAQLRGILASEEISLPDVVRQALDEVSAL